MQTGIELEMIKDLRKLKDRETVEGLLDLCLELPDETRVWIDMAVTTLVEAVKPCKLSKPAAFEIVIKTMMHIVRQREG